MKGHRPKHIPQRTCVACRQVFPKRELVRIVRSLMGEIEVDSAGKKSGRGAYLCRKRPCWEIALKSKVLEHALRVEFTTAAKSNLQEYSNKLPI